MDGRSISLNIYQRLSISILIGLAIIILTQVSFSRESGEPASWATQLAAAQQRAQQIAPDAVLERVVAGPSMDLQDGRYQSLGVSFYFLRPTGEVLRVFLQDTVIESTLEVERYASAEGRVPTELPTKAELEGLKTALSMVRISAADALKVTFDEGQVFTGQQEENQRPIIGLHLNTDTFDIQKEFGIPSAWSVLYITREKELRIWVNAQTGEIVGRTAKTI